MNATDTTPQELTNNAEPAQADDCDAAECSCDLIEPATANHLARYFVCAMCEAARHE